MVCLLEDQLGKGQIKTLHYYKGVKLGFEGVKGWGGCRYVCNVILTGCWLCLKKSAIILSIILSIFWATWKLSLLMGFLHP